MSPKMPVVSARLMIRALERAGFCIHRQSGSHVILKRDHDARRVVVPNHPGDLHRGVTGSILDQAGLSIDQLTELL